MATPNLALPTTPNGATNVSAAYNPAMQILDSVVQMGIEGVLSAPPVTVIGDIGKVWRVGAAATGAWVGKEGQIALCTGANLWDFYLQGTQIKFYLDKTDGGFYRYFSGAWGLAGGLSDAPNNANMYARLGGAWAIVPAAGIADAPNNANTYGRMGAAWVVLPAPGISDAPNDAKTYARKGLAWVDASLAKKPVIALSIASGVVNIDLALGSNFTLSLTANVTSITFSNLPGAGYVGEIDVTLIQDATGGRTVALPASFKALGGSDTSVASAANAATELLAKTKDNGTTWRYAMQESA